MLRRHMATTYDLLMVLIRNVMLTCIASSVATPALAATELRGNFVAVIMAVVFIVLIILASTMSSKRGHRD